MSEANPYNWSNDVLLDALVRVAARAGVSNSGLVIDLSASSDVSQLHYLKGVMLARLHGKQLPFNLGDAVKPKSGGLVKGRVSDGFCPREASFNEPEKIVKLWYLGNDRWEVGFLKFREDDDDGDRVYRNQGPCIRFDADKFVLDSVPSAT